MTYLQFHLVFILPPLVLFTGLAARATLGAERPVGPRASWAVPAVALIAFVYTTPWDNYLVASGVWGYGPERVVGVIGYVPIEEYLFFILQPLLTGSFFQWRLANAEWTDLPDPDLGILGRPPDDGAPRTQEAHRSRPARLAGASLGVLLLVVGVAALQVDGGRYLGLILVWIAPVITGLWWFVAPAAVSLAKPVFHSMLWPTLYLWVADRTAIDLGIWEISEADILGWSPFGLPMEEAAFFLFTNVIVVLGTLLFLWPAMPRSHPERQLERAWGTAGGDDAAVEG